MTDARPAPGWYPDPSRRAEYRYWDGAAWSDRVSRSGQIFTDPPLPGPAAGSDPSITADDKTWAMLSHLLGWILALVALLTKGKDRPFVRDQAVEALNFDITIMIGMFASLVLVFVIVGFFLLFAVAIGGLILHIIAAIQAYNGVRYRYPINIRLIK